MNQALSFYGQFFGSMVAVLLAITLSAHAMAICLDWILDSKWRASTGGLDSRKAELS